VTFEAGYGIHCCHNHGHRAGISEVGERERARIALNVNLLESLANFVELLLADVV
jgi:hypothetical protein